MGVDWEKATEYMHTLEEENKRRLERAKVFNPKDLVRDSRELRVAIDQDTGNVIYYGPLVFADLLEINQAQSNEEKSILILYKMLKKAYKDLTVDDVKAFPLDAVTRLLKLIAGPGGFFQTPKQSRSGSESQLTPSESVSSPTSFK
jgi:hypothetical protein